MSVEADDASCIDDTGNIAADGESRGDDKLAAESEAPEDAEGRQEPGADGRQGEIDLGHLASAIWC